MTLANTGKVAKSTSGGAVEGVAQQATLNQITGVAEANKQVAILKKGKYAYVQYDIRGAAEDFAIGDLVSVKLANSAGCVTKHVAQVLSATPTKAELDAQQAEIQTIVGKAQEAVVWTSGTITGKVKVELMCPMTGDV